MVAAFQSRARTGHRTPITSRIRLVLVLVVPLLVATWAVSLRQSSGPFWLGHNSDPAYPYLLNALALSQGHPVGHADHPGATLQWFGAALLHPIGILAGEDDLVSDVLVRPDFFLSWLHGGWVGLFAITLVAGGFLVWKWTHNPIVGVLFQAGFLLSGICRAALTRLSQLGSKIDYFRGRTARKPA